MKTVVIAILLLGGLVSLLGAVLKWDWMFKSRRSRAVVESLHLEQGRVVYGGIGILLVIVALVLILFPQVSQPFTGKPDALAILSVESDGCTVTRTEVAGMSSIQNILWRITNENFETVGFQSADDVYSYRYNRAGVYDVVLQAWYEGSYVTISNKVEINCTSQTP